MEDFFKAFCETFQAGGLLMAVDPADADALYQELKECVPSAQRIGRVREYQGGKRIFLK